MIHFMLFYYWVAFVNFIHFLFIAYLYQRGKDSAFQNVAGWWGHQPGHNAVGGVSTAHRLAAMLHFEIHPAKIQNFIDDYKRVRKGCSFIFSVL